MGNPQIENGYTKIANELLENLARIRIPGEARQMLDFIFRKTYGYNKKSDGIATSQIMEGTGLGRRGVERSRSILRRMNLISTDKKVGTYYLTYVFNKHYRTWVSTDKKGYTRKEVGSTDKNRGKVPPKRVNTKENTKEKRKTGLSAEHDENQTESEGQREFRRLAAQIAGKKVIV